MLRCFRRGDSCGAACLAGLALDGRAFPISPRRIIWYRSVSPTASCWSHPIWRSPPLSGRLPTRACLSRTIFGGFSPDQNIRRKWRIAHLSDIHAVGEPYGFRIESGRSGPRGNVRLEKLLTCLDRVHADNPIDAVLITGDLTDAGRSAEWSELLDALRAHPRLLERILILPGNHDLNIVDRAIPPASISRQAPTDACGGSGSWRPPMSSRANVSD